MTEQAIMDLIIKNIRPELLVLIPIIWTFGYQFKKIPTLADWKIPWYLLAISVSLATMYCILTTIPFIWISVWIGVVQGCLVWAVEGQLYQTFKQTTTKK